MKNKIYFVPNFGVAKTDENSCVLPKSDKKLLTKLLSSELRLVVLAMELPADDDFLDAALCDDNIDYIILGKASNKKNIFLKIFNYIDSVFHITKEIFFLPKSTLIYIYFPGNIAIISSVISILLRKKYSLYIRGSWSHNKLYVALSGFIFKRAQWVLVTGRGFCNQVSYYNNNVHPVSPMIAFGKGVDSKSDYDVKGPVKLLFVGHIRRSKGIYEVLDAVKYLSKKYNVLLTIVGGGDTDEINRLHDALNKLGISKNVKYAGHVSDENELSKCFLNADIFVYPSYFAEGFPRVIYEAMLHGLPICCTILEGMTGFMIDGKNCLEVESENHVNLSNKLEQFISDKNLRKNMGIAAYTDVNEYINQFNEVDHADQVLDRL